MTKMLESNNKDKIIYLFDDTKLFSDERIEEGAALPGSGGKLLSKLEVSFNSPDANRNFDLQEIIKNCVVPEIVKQGYSACTNFLRSIQIPMSSAGYVGDSDTIFIYTIQQE